MIDEDQCFAKFLLKIIACTMDAIKMKGLLKQPVEKSKSRGQDSVFCPRSSRFCTAVNGGNCS